jgi:hypothetical protein
MTTRKPKSTLSPVIELLTEKLQLVAVTAERKAPARAGWTWQAEIEPLAERSLPKRDKIVLH